MPRPAGETACVIAVTSGKGGVGKTNTSANLGIALAARGARVCIFDADTGMANINVLLGHTPTFTLEHLLSGERTLDELLIEGPHGMRIVPAASGIAECADLDGRRQSLLLDALATLEKRFDYLLIDTAAGAGDAVLNFLRSAQHTVVVVTPDPTSLTNAFSLLKILKNRDILRPTYILTNQVADHAHSLEVFRRLHGAAKKYLELEIWYLGYVVQDHTVTAAIRHQRPVIEFRHDAPASRCFYTLAEAVSRHFGKPGAAESFSAFWSGISAAARPVAERPVPRAEGALPAKPEGLSHALRRKLAASGMPEKKARELLAPLIETFIQRFNASPLDTHRSLFQSLEREGYPAEQMTALALTLEDLFARHHGRPLLDPEYAIARMLADNRLDEDRLSSLARDIERVFERRFGRPVEGRPGDALRAAILDGRLSEEEAREAVRRINRAIERRYPPSLAPAQDGVVTYIGEKRRSNL